MKVGVIGLGNLGSAISTIIAGNGHDILAWEYDSTIVDEVNQKHRNEQYLSDIEFPHTVKATTQVEEVFAQTELIFITLPSRFIVPVLSEPAKVANAFVSVVNMSKGLDKNTGETAFQMVCRLFPNNSKAMLAGPSLANEFVRGVLTGLVAASSDQDLLSRIGEALNNSRFFVTTSDDALGVELGGVLKNIYALGMGLFDGRDDAGLNFMGAYLTQAITEISALGVAMGADKESFAMLSGIGDLITTSMSDQSHNRTMGTLVAQGFSVVEVEAKMGVLPEGYNTLEVALSLKDEHKVDLPLASLINQVILAELNVDEFYDHFAAMMI